MLLNTIITKQTTQIFPFESNMKALFNVVCWCLTSAMLCAKSVIALGAGEEESDQGRLTN